MSTATASKNGIASKAQPKEEQGGTAQVEIPGVAIGTMLVPILGTAPLVVHKFTSKAKRQMLDNMQGRKSPKTAKNPEQDFQDARYRTDDGKDGFPVIGFKAATVSAARFYDKSVSMTMLRQALFFDAPFSRIEGQKLAVIDYEGDEPIMREDVVRVGQGTDLRYRPEYRNWSTVLKISFVESLLSRESVLSLVEAGGMGVGVGEWRVEKRGDFGSFQIDPNREVISV